MIKGNLLFAAVVIALLAVSLAMKEPPAAGAGHTVDHSKYLKFSHTLHVKDQGVACEDCHHDAKKSARSSDNILGDHESCKSCHEEKISSDCAFCHTHPDEIVPIPLPDRALIFSHELHISTHSLKCETCHQELDTVTVASEENLPGMKLCIDCHGARRVSTNCESCHTDLAGLIPADHLAGDFKRDHSQRTRLGGVDVSCSMCHTESFCQDCHTGAELHGFKSTRDLMADPATRMPLRDTPRESKLQNVHDLNYRFTHSIDAKSRRTDCFACHEQQIFCTPCHEAGGNIDQKKIKPESHLAPGFTTIGKGSGGGRHAELARRDIETCISCHDVQGGDPTCMLCHTEGGAVR
jgi:hypothetical protein